jgi:hypothetical protein
MPPTLRTYLWIAGSGFILAASLCFAAYIRFHLPWWTMVLALGLLVGAIVAGLEAAIADPVEKMARGPGKAKDGSFVAPPAPASRFAAAEARRLWRGMRAFQEQGAQLRSAQAGLEARVGRAEREARVMRLACGALRPEADLAAEAPALLRDLAALLGVPAVWLVPLRRHCAVPVIGPDGEPGWGEELRASGLGPWEELLAQDRPLAVCLTDRAPYWRRHFAMESLWVFPLVYHRRAQGFLLARPVGAERTWTPEELALLEAVTPLLAAALHPPRWSDVRKKGDREDDEAPRPRARTLDTSEASEAPAASWLVALSGGEPEAAPPEPAAPATGDAPAAEPPAEPAPSRRERRRRQRAGA